MSHAASPQFAQSCEPWKFRGSAAWGIAALIAWVVGQFVGAFAMFAWYGAEAPAIVAQQGVAGPLAIAITLFAAPWPILVLWFAIRRAGCDFADYMAINPVRRADIVIGLAVVIVLLPLGDLASYLTGRDIVPPFVVTAYKLARDNGTLILLTLAFTVAAPFMEEFIFRGFLYRGFSASRLGVAGGVVVASACWAVMHVQYEVFFIVQIFLLELVFGWLRWRSDSLTLTLGLHSLINLSALIQTAIIVERMS